MSHGRVSDGRHSESLGAKVSKEGGVLDVGQGQHSRRTSVWPLEAGFGASRWLDKWEFIEKSRRDGEQLGFLLEKILQVEGGSLGGLRMLWKEVGMSFERVCEDQSPLL